MVLMDLLKKKSNAESYSNNGMVPALFANIPIKDMKHKPDKS